MTLWEASVCNPLPSSVASVEAPRPTAIRGEPMTIGWALLGPGRHAEGFVVPEMKQAADTRLVAVLSRDRQRAGAFIQSGRPPNAGGLRYVAPILVRTHRSVVAFSLAQLAHQPPGWPERYLLYAPLSLPQRPGEGRYEVASTGPPAGP